MTLREAIDVVERWANNVREFVPTGALPRDVQAMRLVIEAAKQTAGDTVEIATLTETVAPDTTSPV